MIVEAEYVAEIAHAAKKASWDASNLPARLEVLREHRPGHYDLSAYHSHAAHNSGVRAEVRSPLHESPRVVVAGAARERPAGCSNGRDYHIRHIVFYDHTLIKTDVVLNLTLLPLLTVFATNPLCADEQSRPTRAPDIRWSNHQTWVSALA